MHRDIDARKECRLCFFSAGTAFGVAPVFCAYRTDDGKVKDLSSGEKFCRKRRQVTAADRRVCDRYPHGSFCSFEAVFIFGRGEETVAAVFGITVPGKFPFEFRHLSLQKSNPLHNLKVKAYKLLNRFVPMIQGLSVRFVEYGASIL